jgi:hypothetical protein
MDMAIQVELTDRPESCATRLTSPPPLTERDATRLKAMDNHQSDKPRQIS